MIKVVSDAAEHLEALFSNMDNRTWTRINKIYEECEDAWEKNLKRFNGNPIKYLLIGEAAPWPKDGAEVSYFYKKPEGRLLHQVLKAFFQDGPEPIPKKDERFKKLAERGFILIDSLPFAMPYTTRLRISKNYLYLLKSAKSYFYASKINKIKWCREVRIAFAFQWNGCQMIKALDRKLTVPNVGDIPLDESMIAIDEKNKRLSSVERLREIWGLQGK